LGKLGGNEVLKTFVPSGRLPQGRSLAFTLQDAEARMTIPVSTERCIPLGCSEAKSGTLYDGHILF